MSQPTFQGLTSSDCHCWVELEDGKILDYDKETLKYGLYGTTNVKYVAFDDELQPQLYRHWKNELKKIHNQKSYGVVEDSATSYRDMTKDEWVRVIMSTGGYCFFRALTIYNNLIEKDVKCKIVFGSLGFIQPDGSVFYEFG